MTSNPTVFTVANDPGLAASHVVTWSSSAAQLTFGIPLRLTVTSPSVDDRLCSCDATGAVCESPTPGDARKQYTPVLGDVTDSNPLALTSNGEPPFGSTCAHADRPESLLPSAVAYPTPATRQDDHGHDEIRRRPSH